MFVIKATYKDETRRWPHLEDTFPSWNVICDQLHKVFRTIDNFSFNHVDFTPLPGHAPYALSTSNVTGEEEWNEIRKRFGNDVYPAAMLRIHVQDNAYHKSPSKGSSTSETPDVDMAVDSPIPDADYIPERKLKKKRTSFVGDNIQEDQNPTPGPSVGVDASMSEPPTPHSTTSCCSVSENKKSIQQLMVSFLDDFNRQLLVFQEGAVDPTEAHPVVTEPAVTPAATPAAPSSTNPESNAESARADAVDEALFNFRCDHCQKVIRGERWNCRQCYNFDLCTRCVDFEEGFAVHTAHFDEPHVFDVRPTFLNHHHNNNNESATVHMAGCDVCGHRIRGKRFKCVDCPDYDMCNECFRSRREVHEADHSFYEPTVDRAVQTSTRPLPVPITVPSPTPTVTVPSGAIRPVVHQARCDLCSESVTGIRWKCLGCPDFDLCNTCITIAPEQHPNHSFVKVRRPEHIKTPIRYVAKTIHSASCDGCGDHIIGVRYKCLHPSCPDIDFCANCEALPIPVHPIDHPLVKMHQQVTSYENLLKVFKFAHTKEAPVPAVTLCAKPTVPSSISSSLVSLPGSLPDMTTIDASYLPSIPGTSNPVVQVRELELSDSLLGLMNAPAASSITGSPLSLLPIEPPSSEPSPMGKETRIPGSFVDVSAPSVAESPVSIPTLAPLLVPVEAPVETHPETLPVDASVTTINPFDDPPSVASPVSVKSPLTRVSASFVADNTIPDGFVLPCGARFQKSWKLVNDGTVAWPETTQLNFLGGHRMGTSLADVFLVGAGTEPGQEVDIKVDFVAPEIPGRFTNYWRLKDGQGTTFGHRMWCDINVVADSSAPSASSSLSSSQVIMPSAVTVSATAFDLATPTEDAPRAGPSEISSPALSSVPSELTWDSSEHAEDRSEASEDSFTEDSDSDEELWAEAIRNGNPHQAQPNEFVLVYDTASEGGSDH